MKEERRIAYIMSRFPGLSETFILREMCEMERLGWLVELYPLIYQEEAIVHDEAKNWMTQARRPSFYEIVVANVRQIFASPWVYFFTLFHVLLGNIRSPKFLSRAIVVFPKAVWMAQQMLREQVMHVHAHYGTHPALAAWIINRVSGIPYGVTVHAHDIFVDKSMLRRKLQDAIYIVAISEYNKKFLVSLLGDWVAEKTHVIHCGIYPDMYTSEPAVRDKEKFEILSIGSLRPYKGFKFLLEACSLLKQTGTRFRCRIIGGGELQGVLSAQINYLAIDDVVELIGPKNQKEVADLLRSADCYVQPSVIEPTGKMEGIPVSLMEAMACGLPVIATDISGIPELVRHGETGWLVPPEDPHALADAVMDIYSNPYKAGGYAKLGRDLVYKEFNVNLNVDQLSRLFEML